MREEYRMEEKAERTAGEGGSEDSHPLRDWLLIITIAVLFVCWGFFAFWTVGDKGPPDWDFGVIPDVPGESPYSTVGTVPEPVPENPEPQHVSERPAQAEGEVAR